MPKIANNFVHHHLGALRHLPALGPRLDGGSIPPQDQHYSLSGVVGAPLIELKWAEEASKVSSVFRQLHAHAVSKLFEHIENEEFDTIIPYANQACNGDRGAREVLRLFISSYSFLYYKDLERIRDLGKWSNPLDRIPDEVGDDDDYDFMTSDPNASALCFFFDLWGEIACYDNYAYHTLAWISKGWHELAEDAVKRRNEAVRKTPSQEARQIRSLLMDVERYRFDRLRPYARNASHGDVTSNFILGSFAHEFSNRYHEDMNMLRAFAGWCMSFTETLVIDDSSDEMGEVIDILSFFKAEARDNSAAYVVLDVLGGLNVEGALILLGHIPAEHRPEEHPASVAQSGADRLHEVVNAALDYMVPRMFSGEVEIETDASYGFGPGGVDTAVDKMFTQMVADIDAWVHSAAMDEDVDGQHYPNDRLNYIIDAGCHSAHELHRSAVENLVEAIKRDLKALRLFKVFCYDSKYAVRLMRAFDHEILIKLLGLGPDALHDIAAFATLGNYAARGIMMSRADIEPYRTNRYLLLELAQADNEAAKRALDDLDEQAASAEVVTLRLPVDHADGEE